MSKTWNTWDYLTGEVAIEKADKFEILFDIVDKFNVLTERLRAAKLGGTNADFMLIIEVHGDVRNAPILPLLTLYDARELAAWCNASDGMSGNFWPKVEDGCGVLRYDVFSVPLVGGKGYVKCPRCRKFHKSEDWANYDNLCNRCVDVMKQLPDHEATRAMLEWECLRHNGENND